MTSGFILVHYLFVGDRINYASGCIEYSLSSSFVARFDGLGYALDCGT